MVMSTKGVAGHKSWSSGEERYVVAETRVSAPWPFRFRRSIRSPSRAVREGLRMDRMLGDPPEIVQH